ncbi:MAG: PAS domain S-box protein, partial [Desulfitobacteriaceae bacterium]|nr:PAS domain S-box protein [Desulfitobacteriaceae bacterium]
MNSKKTSVNPYLVRYDTSLQDISLIFEQDDDIEFLLVCDAEKQIIGRILPQNIVEANEIGLAPDTPVQQVIPFEQQFIDFINNLQFVLGDSMSSLHSMITNETVAEYYFRLIWRLCRIWHKNATEWEACFDSVYNPVISIDEDGRINLFNRALERVSGIAASEARGQKITDIFSNSKLIEVLTTGQTQPTRKIQYQDKILLTNRTPLYKNGKIAGAVAVLQDISELEHIAEQLARTRELNRQLDAIFESSFDGLYLTD